ncbi:MAG: zinc dependent phospholipase C family protein [Bacteroidota bacterium]
MYKPILVLFLCLSLLTPRQAAAWGFWAHQRINRLAVFTLPPEMLLLYKKHLNYLTEHAVDPDKRRYAVDGEAPRHFIDIDHYGTYPFQQVPREWDEAVALLTEDTLMAYGNLPYHLPQDVYRLKKAFEAMDLGRILKISADLGHYVGDAHVPLHTTENYNGQMTGQRGIHGFWESRLPELYGEKYDFLVGRAYFIEDLLMEGWETVLESHLALDSVLSMEQRLNDRFPPSQKYGYESRNNIVVRTYSRDYSAAYHKMLSGMVERRMRLAIRRIGSYWYTAWKLAGSPDLAPLIDKNYDLAPDPTEKKIKILDREAFDLGSTNPLFPQEGNWCCAHPLKKGKAMGLWAVRPQFRPAPLAELSANPLAVSWLAGLVIGLGLVLGLGWVSWRKGRASHPSKDRTSI